MATLRPSQLFQYGSVQDVVMDVWRAVDALFEQLRASTSEAAFPSVVKGVKSWRTESALAYMEPILAKVPSLRRSYPVAMRVFVHDRGAEVNDDTGIKLPRTSAFLYAAFSVVCASPSVTQSTFFTHDATKMSVLRRAVQEAMRQMWDRVQAVQATGATLLRTKHSMARRRHTALARHTSASRASASSTVMSKPHSTTVSSRRRQHNTSVVRHRGRQTHVETDNSVVEAARSAYQTRSSLWPSTSHLQETQMTSDSVGTTQIGSAMSRKTKRTHAVVANVPVTAVRTKTRKSQLQPRASRAGRHKQDYDVKGLFSNPDGSLYQVPERAHTELPTHFRRLRLPGNTQSCTQFLSRFPDRPIGRHNSGSAMGGIVEE